MSEIGCILAGYVSAVGDVVETPGNDNPRQADQPGFKSLACSLTTASDLLKEAGVPHVLSAASKRVLDNRLKISTPGK